jgi:hypothetical protein
MAWLTRSLQCVPTRAIQLVPVICYIDSLHLTVLRVLSKRMYDACLSTCSQTLSSNENATAPRHMLPPKSQVQASCNITLASHSTPTRASPQAPYPGAHASSTNERVCTDCAKEHSRARASTSCRQCPWACLAAIATSGCVCIVSRCMRPSSR